MSRLEKTGLPEEFSGRGGMDSQAAGRYARALFEIGRQRSLLEALDRDFETVAGSLARHPEILRFAANSTISLTEREAMVERVFAGTESLLGRFLKVLIRKKRFSEIFQIQQEFRRRYEKARGIQEVRVLTARPLGGENELKLTDALRRRLRAEIRLVKATEPGIIGGMILRFDGSEIDGSYRSRLAKLHQLLISR